MATGSRCLHSVISRQRLPCYTALHNSPFSCHQLQPSRLLGSFSRISSTLPRLSSTSPAQSTVLNCGAVTVAMTAAVSDSANAASLEIASKLSSENEEQVPSGKSIEELEWDNSFVSELPGDTNLQNNVRIVRNSVYSFVTPSLRLGDVELVAHSADVAHLIGLDPEECERPEFAQAMAGAFVIQGSQPYAQCYGGHQFGSWAGQLGDGRAITLGEVLPPSPLKDPSKPPPRFELQLKGAGKTPYSRHADGRAVLRSSVREFLASEALHWLGVPTTRALSLVTTGEKVLRDMFYNGNARMEPGAVVCRVAPSFLRFGSFQLPASRGGLEKELVRVMADYAIKYHFLHLTDLPDPDRTDEVARQEGKKDGGEEGGDKTADDVDVKDNKYAAWFLEISSLTGSLVASWQAVGFTHGVLNTDNMSILGLTIDYGPFGFLDSFDPQFTPNTSDLPGRRYCFQNQPDIGLWNIVQLANALVTAGLLSVVEAQHCVGGYADAFMSAYQSRMASKLGLLSYDKEMTQSLLRLMASDSVDFTNLFRALSRIRSLKDQSDLDLIKPIAAVLGEEVTGDEGRQGKWLEWLRGYTARLAEEGQADEARKAAMDAVNPVYILRNYLLQEAIEAAEKGDYSGVRQLLELVKDPFNAQEGMERFTAPPPEWAKKPGVCMLSCSS